MLESNGIRSGRLVDGGERRKDGGQTARLAGGPVLVEAGRIRPVTAYNAQAPASMGMTVPVTWGDSSDARYRASRDTSTGSARRLRGRPRR